MLVEASESIGDSGTAKVFATTLSVVDRSLLSILRERVTDTTLVLADPYNFPEASRFRSAVCVDGADVERCRNLVNRSGQDVIAIGGCSVLDVGRYIAYRSKSRLTAIPSILSTTCISVNRSVLYHHDTPVRRVAVAPAETIISLPLLMSGHPETVAKWTHSGLGDLFANLSAAIDFAVRGPESGSAARDILQALVPDTFAALDWCLNTFRRYDEEALVRIASFLHNSSMDVIINNSTALSAAGEHDLYYALIKRRKYSRQCPTHGELVSVGTLISALVYSWDYREADLYRQLREAFIRVGLPVNFRELKTVGVEREHILDGLTSIQGTGSFLLDAMAKTSGQALDDCFHDG
jgi:glycerol dehydrogenase-like iron-containing ADH family enzyme